MLRGVIPCALEFMEQACLLAIEARRGEKVPHSEAAACLLIEVDGMHEEMLDREMEIIGETLLECGATDVDVADGPAQQLKLWEIRRAAGEAVKGISPYKEEDTVVPRSNLPQLVKGVHEICDRHGVRMICYGHAGDGNIHVNLLRESTEQSEWDLRTSKAIPEIFDLTVALGGTISGEHGIGFVQKNYLRQGLSDAAIESMRQVKRALDPKGILNPGKVFPDAAH